MRLLEITGRPYQRSDARQSDQRKGIRICHEQPPVVWRLKVQVGSQFVEVPEQRQQLGVSCSWQPHNRTCAPVQRKSRNNVAEFRSMLTYISTRTEQSFFFARKKHEAEGACRAQTRPHQRLCCPQNGSGPEAVIRRTCSKVP